MALDKGAITDQHVLLLPVERMRDLLLGLHRAHVNVHIHCNGDLAAEAVLIQEGDIGSSFFILASGEVEVRKQGRLLNTLRSGECFGEMAYLGKQKFQRSASVVATTAVVAIEIRAETLPQASELCRHHFNGAFLELLVDRLATANLRLSQLLTERNISVF